jgi:hypothetical protein
MKPQVGQRWVHMSQAVLEIKDISDIESVYCKVITIFSKKYCYKLASEMEFCFNCCVASKIYLKGQDRVSEI